LDELIKKECQEHKQRTK